MHCLRGKNPLKALSPEQVAQFDRDGFLLPLHGVSHKEAVEARARLERAEIENNKSGNFLNTNGHVLNRWHYELATQPHILDVVEDLIGPNFYIWKSQCWIKEKGSNSWIGWHQDAAYWGLDPPDSVNVWLALTDVTPKSGPMEFYAGSHVEPLRKHSDDYTPDNMLTRGQVIPELQDPNNRDPNRVVPAVLRPGQYSIHHLSTAHGGGPNHGDDRRIGFNVTYCASPVRSVRADGAFGMPIRGQWLGALVDPPMEIDPVPPPGDTPDPVNIEAHGKKTRGTGSTVMSDADMDKFARVSQERVGRNLPPHVTASDASATSLASVALTPAPTEKASVALTPAPTGGESPPKAKL